MADEPTFEELHAAFGETPEEPSAEELNAAFEPKESTLEKAKRNALGFATGVGRGALFGQDIPAAIAAGL